MAFLKIKKIRINLNVKLLTIFLVISLVPLITAIYVSFDSAQKTLEQGAIYRLSKISNQKIEQINSYFSEIKKEIATLSRWPGLPDIVENIDYSPENINSRTELFPDISTIKNSSDFIDLLLISNGGKTLSLTERKIIATENQNNTLTNLMVNVTTSRKTEMSVFKYFPDEKLLISFIASPIIKQEKIIGFLILKINNKGIYPFIQDYSDLGKMGDSLVVYKYGNEAIFAAPLRRNIRAAFQQNVSLESLKLKNFSDALTQQSGSGIINDYEGVKVVAVWEYLPTFQCSLIIKMDYQEILFSAGQLKNILLSISSIFLIIVVLIIIVTANSIVRPIRDLNLAAMEISRGNLSKRAEIKSNDEIEDLAYSFNEMTDRLLEKSQGLSINLEKLEQEKEKIEAILYSIGDGVFVVNDNRQVSLFNRIAEELTGVIKEDVLNKKYDEFFKFVYNKDNNESASKFIEISILAGEIKSTENNCILVKKNGDKLPVAGISAPLKGVDGQIVGAVVVFRDVTKEREIDQAKTEFVSLTSHQLRTPISAINWYAEMLLKEEVGKINSEQKNYLQYIYDSNHRMIELVNALLSVSRIELGTFVIEPEPINLIDLIEDVLKDFVLLIKDGKIKINKKYDLESPIINADPRLLRIVLQNLISNAIKYNSGKREINIEANKNKEFFLIKVSDTGYGIPKYQQTKIFTKLFRADNIKVKNTDGNGLGLYITKAIIEQAGGKIWFESEENKGSSFFFTIPLSGMRKKNGIRPLIE